MSDLSKNAKTEQRNKRAAEKAAAEVAQEIEEAVRKEKKGARINTRLYNFDPEKIGGYTRVPNVYWENLSSFRAFNLKTGELRKDKSGNCLHVSKVVDSKGNLVDYPAPLEPIDHLILMTLLMWYQRKANAMAIQFSVRDLAKKIGKSERQIHRVVKKLRDLNYIRELGKIGVPGGHVVNYDITPFLSYLKSIADKARLRKAEKERDSLSDFGKQAHPFEDVLKDFEVVPNER